jgi:hypothetical protein
MTRKVYRTAQGKMVDLGALQLRNENVRAVGNMGVNARGDLIDSNNRSIDTKNQQVSRQYQKQTNVDSTPVQSSRNKASRPVQQAPAVSAPVIPTPPEDFDEDFNKEEIIAGLEAPESAPPPPAGLAAAIARARSVKQEPLKTPRQIAQDRNGVNRI